MPRLYSTVGCWFVLGWALAGCQQGPPDPGAAAAGVRQSVAAGDDAGAEELLREGIARWPQDSGLRELQGDLDLQRGRANLAQAAYEKAIQLDPLNRALVVKLARCMLQQGHYREVLGMAPATDTDPADLRAGLALAHLEAQLALGSSDFRSRREEAEALWRLAAGNAASPALPDIATWLATLAKQYDVIEAGRQHAQCRPAPARMQPAAAVATADAPGVQVLRVGPGEKLRRPSDAAAVAPDGAVVEIEAGAYRGDTAVWRQSRLTLRSRGGRAHIIAPPKLAQDKGVWLITGDNTTVEGMEFSGAKGPNHNGSGIRLEGSHLTVRDSVFHDNQGGIMTANNTPDSEIVITHSEFRHNVSGSLAGQRGHNIYIGRAGRFTLEFSYVHGAAFGHNVKSRARANFIRYNRIVDEEEGRSSYLVDLPEGGTAEIVGNELQKGPFADNYPFITYGEEAAGYLHRDNRLFVVNNTFYSGAFEAVAVKLAIEAPAVMANNLFAGAVLTQATGAVVREHNVVLIGGGLEDPKAGDFELTRDSSAVDTGVEATASGEAIPAPEFEYRHPLGAAPRPQVWHRDAGAHEYCQDPDDPGGSS